MDRAVHIGKAGRLAGISVDTIRFYQRLGLIKATDRSTGGYRLFDDSQIHDLKFIRRAQSLGFSLNEIKELLALRQKHHTCSEVQSMLEHKLTDVQDRIQSLIHLETELKQALRKCNRELRLKQETKHGDCCPLLEKLDEVNGEKRAATRRKSASK